MPLGCPTEENKKYAPFIIKLGFHSIFNPLFSFILIDLRHAA
jgi:hypothetical protein